MMSTCVLYGHRDAILCKVFLRSLKGVALKWFGELSPNTISSYANIVRLFITHFVSYQIARKKAHNMLSLTQEPNETLEKFIKRLKKRIDVECIEEPIIVETFIRGVKPDIPIHVSLIKSPPTIEDEAMAKALKYIL